MPLDGILSKSIQRRVSVAGQAGGRRMRIPYVHVHEQTGNTVSGSAGKTAESINTQAKASK